MSDKQDAAIEATPPAPPPTRDDIRARILGTTHKPKSKVIEFFGVEIELRQPIMDDILNVQSLEGEERMAGILGVLIRQAYVPGTDNKVFEAGDLDQLRTLPMGGDITKVVETLGELSDVNFLDKKAGSA